MTDEKLKQFGIKKLDPSVLEFDANGKKYSIVNSISIGRSIQYELYLLELQTGKAVVNWRDELKQSYNFLNERKFADAAVSINNLMVGTELNLTRTNAMLKICACIMCVEGEDARQELTDEQIAAKIDDWIIEGYDKDSFFQFAVTFAYGTAQN